MSESKPTAGSLIVQLRHQYDDKAWAFLEQVRGGTGSNGSRYADALAMSLWPSRGFDVVGFEVKVSRSDWLKELKEPAKADEIFCFCNYWWLIVANESIVRDGELPRTWGLQVLRDGELHTAHKAPQLTPEPLSPAFIASVLRRVSKAEPGAERLNDSYQAGWRDGEKHADKNGKHAAIYQSQEHDRLKAALSAFEAASGVKIENWNGEIIGEAFKRFNESERNLDRAKREMGNLKRGAERILELTKEQP